MSFASYEAMPLGTMLARIQKYYPGDGYKAVEQAWLFAEEAHRGQVRKSGEPYFIHPCFVASILTDLMLDPPTTRWRTAKRYPLKQSRTGSAMRWPSWSTA